MNEPRVTLRQLIENCLSFGTFPNSLPLVVIRAKKPKEKNPEMEAFSAEYLSALKNKDYYKTAEIHHMYFDKLTGALYITLAE